MEHHIEGVQTLLMHLVRENFLYKEEHQNEFAAAAAKEFLNQGCTVNVLKRQHLMWGTKRACYLSFTGLQM